MSDLRVNTLELRETAFGLRGAGRVAAEVADDGGQLRSYVSCVGGRRTAEALGGFLGEWTYGMGLIGHDVDTLAAYLDCCADAYEAAEYQLAAAAGAAPVTGPPVNSSAVMPALPGRRRLEYWTDLDGLGRPITLASATHWRQLLPGDPAELATLNTRLRGFADSAAGAAANLSRLSGTSWVGQAATMFAGHIGATPGRLSGAADAFDTAAGALRRYIDALEDAQRGAATAFTAWQDAQARAETAARAGTAPLPGAPTPEQDMDTAARKLTFAQDDAATAGRALASALDEAGDRAPNEPGLLSRIGSAVTSFATGVGEGTVGMVTGAAALVELSVKLSPAYALIDPEDYLATVEGVVNGVELAIQHPGATAKALVDWDTWSEDPARALGRLVPELLLTLATAGAGGAAKAGSATRRLDRAADLIRKKGDDVFVDPGTEVRRGRVIERGYDPESPSGQAAKQQVELPYDKTDVWTDTTLVPGQRIAVGLPGVTGFAVPVGTDIATAGSRAWFEGLQVAPRRMFDESGGPVPQPTLRQDLAILEVRGDVPAAAATTRANPQFGPGGADEVFVPEIRDRISDGSLVQVGEHRFDLDSIESSIEDPRFKAVDPTLPDRALDPARERSAGRLEGAAGGAAVGTAATHEPIPGDRL